MQSKRADNVKVIDVSHHQGAIGWAAVKADGVCGAFIKASEGASYIDSQLSVNVKGAEGAAIPVSFYHYAHPEINDAETEAAHFAKVVAPFPSTFPLVLDVEGAASAVGNAALTKWCAEWLREVTRLTGRPTMIYTGASFAKSYLGKDLASYPLWVAHYGADKPMDNATWGVWAAFQYTSSGKVAGINGNVDVNAMERDFYDKYVKGDGDEMTADEKAEFVALKDTVAALTAKDSQKCPEWAKEAVYAAKMAGLIDTADGGSYDFYRFVTIMHRAGTF